MARRILVDGRALPRVLRGGVQAGAGQMQPAMARVLVGGEEGQHPQGLRVALEAVQHAVGEVQFVHRGAQRQLTGVPEGRMADVVGHARRFDERRIRAAVLALQPLGHPPAELCHLHRVRQPGVVRAQLGARHHLALAGQRPPLRGVQDPVDVVLEPGALPVVGHPPSQGVLLEILIAVSGRSHARMVVRRAGPGPAGGRSGVQPAPPARGSRACGRACRGWASARRRRSLHSRHLP